MKLYTKILKVFLFSVVVIFTIFFIYKWKINKTEKECVLFAKTEVVKSLLYEILYNKKYETLSDVQKQEIGESLSEKVKENIEKLNTFVTEDKVYKKFYDTCLAEKWFYYRNISNNFY